MFRMYPRYLYYYFLADTVERFKFRGWTDAIQKEDFFAQTRFAESQNLPMPLPDNLALHLFKGRMDVVSNNPNNSQRTVLWHSASSETTLLSKYLPQFKTTLPVETGSFNGQECVLAALVVEGNRCAGKELVYPIGIWCDGAMLTETMPGSLEQLCLHPVIGKPGNAWRNLYNSMAADEIAQLFFTVLAPLSALGFIVWSVIQADWQTFFTISLPVILVLGFAGYWVLWFFFKALFFVLAPGLFSSKNTIYNLAQARQFVSLTMHHLRDTDVFSQVAGNSPQSNGRL